MLYQNNENFSPIIGMISRTALANPCMMFPTNDPNANPIFSRIGIPLSKNPSHLSANAPKPTTIAPTATINTANTPMPINAAGPNDPATPRMTQAADKESNNVDNELAIGTHVSGSISKTS